LIGGRRYGHGVRVGVLLLPIDPWAQTVERVQRLEALGYDHVWTYDHLSWRRYREHDWHATIPWLTGVAAATRRVRLGTMMTSPNFRHPVALAKDAMTLDHVSNGRLTLGIGAGGLGFDATVFGGEPLSERARADRLIEFVEVVDRLLREPRVSHRGPHYVVDDARMLPGCLQQPRVPLAIAAGGPRTLALTARYADAWITYGDTSYQDLTAAGTETIVVEQADRLATACAAIGRDAAEIDRIYLIGNTEARPLASTDAFADFAGRYATLGFTDLVFHHPVPDDPVWYEPEAIVEEIATDVLPGLR
jgi:alkanesulfonate monooxygenase SsuD/methylene tetrahydromethanopterin reductase-like flavin-dependent oxidoreductase (luciferase family)